MSPPKFDNRPNTLHHIDGRPVWESRSVVVIAAVLLRKGDEIYVLITRRAPGMLEGGSWCLPCGFIDFNESGEDGACREVYEETGLDIYKDSWWINYKDPFRVKTEPTERQNISLSYVFTKEMKDFPIMKGTPDPIEVSEVKWISLKDLSSYALVFNHDEVIETALCYVNQS